MWRSRTFLLVVYLFHLSNGIPHHGGPHFFDTSSKPEHRSMMLAEDTFQSRMGAVQWPDSHSHWADVPTSQSFHEGWSSPQKKQSSASLDSRFDISSDDLVHDNGPPSSSGVPHFSHFEGGPEFDHPSFPSSAKANTFESFRPSTGFDYQVNYEERPKRNQASFPVGPPPSSGNRFSPPTFDQFRPVDFGIEAPPSQSIPRPIRHTSFPASSSAIFRGSHDEGHLGAIESEESPDFSLKPFGQSHSYTTFEAPKVNSNVFIDHAREEVKRPARASPPFPRPPATPAAASFQPSNVNFLPQKIQKNINDHFTGRPQQSSPPPSSLSYAGHQEDNVDVYDYLEDEIDHLNNLGERFQFEKKRQQASLPGPSQPNAIDDINGSPDYNTYHRPNHYQFTPPEAVDPEPFEYRDRGRHHDERYDRENREESGKYNVQNYRRPIEAIKYEKEDPVEINHYGDSFGGVQTFKGGYDSEEDAKRGIQRNFNRPDLADIYIEEEPLDDYNREGYYVPQERAHHQQRAPEEEDDEAESEEESQDVWRPKQYRYESHPRDNEEEEEEGEEDYATPPRRRHPHRRPQSSMRKRPMKEDFAEASSHPQPFWTSLGL